tara:strand:+ start:61 stop:342 length:282 start_codon:yes stop_codon:yes gene_type:complete
MSKLKTIIKKTKSIGKPSGIFKGDTDRFFNQTVTDRIDELKELIQGKEASTSSGKVGSIRVIIDKDTPYVEIKSNKGWIRSSNSSASGFEFKK